MPSTYCISLWGQCCVLWLLLWVTSRFSNIMGPRNEVSCLPEYIEWGVCFSSLTAQTYFQMTVAGLIRLKLWKRCSDCIIFTHRLATTESRPTLPWEPLGCAGEDLGSGPTLGGKWIQHQTETNGRSLLKQSHSKRIHNQSLRRTGSFF